MRFDVITLFPAIIEAPLRQTILKRAIDNGLIHVHAHQLRDHAVGPHRQVDDEPYGGGSGMVLKPEPIFAAVESIRAQDDSLSTRTILLSPQGRPFDHEHAVRLSLFQRLVLICGRYEGVDERVRQALSDEDISIGDYVLTGGELPALVLIDAVARLLPGVVGEGASVLGDTFTDGLLQHPHYTRPATFRDKKVPDVLLSGHHGDIEAWRRRMALENTMKRRPDLLARRRSGESTKTEHG